MSSAQESKRSKADVNPLFNPRFRDHSVNTTKESHLPRLTHKKANYKYIFLGGDHWDRYLTSGSGKVYDHETERFVSKDGQENLWHKYQQNGAINMGVSGDGIQEVMCRLFKLKTIDHFPEEPKNIVLWVGTNDIERYTEDVVFDGLINLITKIQDSYNRIKKKVNLTVVSVLPRFSRSKKISISSLNRSIIRLNWMLAQSAKECEYTFLDVYFKFYENHRILDQYFIDHVHLNHDGYKIFDAELMKHLELKVEKKTESKEVMAKV